MFFLGTEFIQNPHLLIGCGDSVSAEVSKSKSRLRGLIALCAVQNVRRVVQCFLFCFLFRLKNITKMFHAYLPLDFLKHGRKPLMFFSVAQVLFISRLERSLGTHVLSSSRPLKTMFIAADVFYVI